MHACRLVRHCSGCREEMGLFASESHFRCARDLTSPTWGIAISFNLLQATFLHL